MSADLLLLLASEVYLPASEQQHLTRMATTLHSYRFGLLAGRFSTASGHFSIEGTAKCKTRSSKRCDSKQKASYRRWRFHSEWADLYDVGRPAVIARQGGAFPSQRAATPHQNGNNPAFVPFWAAFSPPQATFRSKAAAKCKMRSSKRCDSKQKASYRRWTFHSNGADLYHVGRPAVIARQ